MDLELNQRQQQELLNAVAALTQAVVQLTAVVDSGFTKVVVALGPSPDEVSEQILFGGTPALAPKISIVGGTKTMKAGSTFKAARKGATGPVAIAPGQKIAVIGANINGVPGAPLAPGASIAFIPLPDPTLATIDIDAPALKFNYTDANGVAQTNIQSLLSGTVKDAVPPNDGPVATVGYAITNADGTPGRTGSAQFTLSPLAEVSEVLIFD